MKLYKWVIGKLCDFLDACHAPDWTFTVCRELEITPYRIKCWFVRPNRIESRYLSKAYVDKADLLPHVIFETFCQFYEKEVLTMTHDWCIDFAAHKIEFGGQERGVDEVFEWLYNWWHFYQKQVNYDWAYYKDLRDNVELGTTPTENPYMLRITVKYKDENAHEKLRLRNTRKELSRQKMLEENLILIIKLKDLMWT